MTHAPAPEAGFVTFDTLTAERPETADALVEALVAEDRGRLRHAPGFLSGRVHLSTDRLTVVHRVLWRDAADHRAAFPDRPGGGVPADLASRPGVRRATSFHGSPVPGITGPALGRRPGHVAVATRHLRDAGSFDTLMKLLVDSGTWKRHHRGFISATPHISPDGLTFVNYAAWEDEDSHRAWMADPRISEGQEEIARLEGAPPEYVVCVVAADTPAA